MTGVVPVALGTITSFTKLECPSMMEMQAIGSLKKFGSAENYMITLCVIRFSSLFRADRVQAENFILQLIL